MGIKLGSAEMMGTTSLMLIGYISGQAQAVGNPTFMDCLEKP
jgi:hypothetical protein